MNEKPYQPFYKPYGMTDEEYEYEKRIAAEKLAEWEQEQNESNLLDVQVILKKAGMIGNWKIVDKIKRECNHCKQPLHSAERKTILHGYERATICLECKTVHPQERFWNGR